MQLNAMMNQKVASAISATVLVVEDEFLIRMIVADHLRETGFTVVEACNGDEAITILKSGVPFDLVFTDVRMPGSTDGLGLLAYVKSTQPELPVVMTSGHLAPGLALSGGATQFLSKPCDLDTITEALSAAILQPS